MTPATTASFASNPTRKWLLILGSPKLALVGMGLLAAGAGLNYGNPVDMPNWVLVGPLALMAFNLLCAICGYPRIHRQAGLLIFHLGLVAIVVLAAVGRLTFFEARVEVLEGSPFQAQELMDARHGPWHRNSLSDVQFVQSRYTIEYSPGLVRGRTFNQVLVPNQNGEWENQIIGDDRPLVLDGYRFYTTFNKGYAPLLTWMPEDGSEPITGAVHMPSYPMFAHKQDQTWQPPRGPDLRLWLRLDTGLNERENWVLNSRPVGSVLVVNDGAERYELVPGQTLKLAGGRLRYEQLLTWMGYKLFYDPTLHWMFAAAMLSVAGMGWHFWTRFGRLDTRATAPVLPANVSHSTWVAKPVRGES